MAGVVGVGAVALMRRDFPQVSSLSTVLRTVNPWWALVALVLGTASQFAFAYQQRVLMVAMGVPLRRRDAIALTYSSGAICMVAPAGGAVAAAYTFRHYQRRGADHAVALTVTLVSGVITVLSLLMLFGAGSVVSAGLSATTWRPLDLGASLSAVAVVALLLLGMRFRSALAVRSRDLLNRFSLFARLLRQADRALRASRAVGGRDWAAALALAAGKWVLDLACLLAVAEAFRADVGWVRVAAVYLTMQVVRQIPVTPGGIGLIEASLLAGLTTAGAGAASAFAVVLGYRLITFWLVLPVGFAAHLMLRAAPVAERPTRVARAG
ncbi:flippase-like domain-containing protein [Actinoplanes hulinensis]|uniref:Flippase-like domain-containing protein n=1 Tax=Actinoplanes hulinensis TaxID=1144547 RepID=A0ABS7B7K0_9ACTN|nr:lysylphosphatidylglycerol synthase transmembrane domain-containing protein [Actinoplanes hulinensis]MBW6436897.1 flippase-like domain-containing protein [Actinoplanes hulinensis]